MNAELKALFGEMFLSFLAYGFEQENCLSKLADVTGQLKTTCATLVNAVIAFGILLMLDQCSKSLSSCSA